MQVYKSITSEVIEIHDLTRKMIKNRIGDCCYAYTTLPRDRPANSYYSIDSLCAIATGLNRNFRACKGPTMQVA